MEVSNERDNQADCREYFDCSKYRRTLGVIWLDNVNLNLSMVRAGQAWTYRKYCSDPVYLAGEADARRAHLGLWRGPVAMAPWEWRHRPKAPKVK